MPSHSTVYVVDDDPSVRKALGRVLRGAGMECRAFASGEDFLHEVPPTASGCVILDISMPGMSGHDLQAKLHKQDYRLKVIILSARDDPETRELSWELGASTFFRKPVDNKALLDAIHWALEATPHTQ